MLIIGDVHGKIDSYWKLLQKLKPEQSIQVGDFGFAKQHQWFLQNIDYSSHRILFGNHDDYAYLNHPHSLGNWAHIPLYTNCNLFAIRGAFSVDKWHRTEGKSWWANEELTYEQFQRCMDDYEVFKPEIVLSHDCPQTVKEYLFGYKDKTTTGQGLQACFQIHQPLLWVFGHYHERRDMVIDGTRFVCLEELGTIEI